MLQCGILSIYAKSHSLGWAAVGGNVNCPHHLHAPRLPCQETQIVKADGAGLVTSEHFCKTLKSEPYWALFEPSREMPGLNS